MADETLGDPHCPLDRGSDVVVDAFLKGLPNAKVSPLGRQVISPVSNDLLSTTEYHLTVKHTNDVAFVPLCDRR